ncbi:MAG: amidohydrolase, partial [Oscillospiraceae bacterium]|nr:amidohydrolase [Oscillospiraceae bacterium]
ETIDLAEKSIYPGFIDAHTHLGMWEDSLGFEGDDGNEESDPATPHLRAIDAVNSFDLCFHEALAAGVTTVVTGPGSANPIAGQLICLKTLGGRIDPLVIKSPVAMKMALGENPKSVYHAKHEAPYTRMATAAIIREQLRLAQRYLADLEKSEREEEADPPDYDIKLEALLPVLRCEIPVHIHAHRRDDIFTALRISEEFGLKCVIVHATEGHLASDELIKSGVPILSGPFLCDRSKPELRGLTPASAGIMSTAGVPLAIITDHPVTPVQYLPLCAGLAVREGMSHGDALRAITINPAKILGIDHRVGSLAVGKDADFSVFSADPLTLSAKPEMVVVNGGAVFNQIQKKDVE